MEIRAEDIGLILVILGLILLGFSFDLVLRFISAATLVFASILIGVGLSNPHTAIDLSLLRKRSHKE